jgi:hypothetical protein
VYVDTAEERKDLSKHKTQSGVRKEKHRALKLISNFFEKKNFFGSMLIISHFLPTRIGKGFGFRFYALSFL